VHTNSAIAYMDNLDSGGLVHIHMRTPCVYDFYPSICVILLHLHWRMAMLQFGSLQATSVCICTT